VLPFPTWRTTKGTLITDEQAQRDIVANHRDRGIKMVIDYEHQTEFGGEAPAAGWVPQGGLIAGGEQGLIADNVEWNPRAAGYIANKEHEYHSPVALFNKKTMRVFALRSIALTNTPATNDQTPLSEQIAAKAIDEYERTTGKGEEGRMKEFLKSLMGLATIKATSTVSSLIASVKSALAELEKLDGNQTIAASAGDAIAEADKEKPLAELIGIAIASATAKTVVASKEVLALLGLKEDADLATVTATVVALKHPADMVSRAEYDKVVAKLAEVDKTTASARIDDLMKANRDRLGAPGSELEKDMRKIAATNFDLAKSTIEKLPVQKPKSVAGEEPPEEKHSTVATKMTVRGEEVKVDAESAALVAKIEAYQREHKIPTYAEATKKYHASLR